MAIDGKTLKSSRRRDTKALHVVLAFSTRVSVVVGDVVLEPDQSEITAALALLKQLPLDGAIVTGDAIFCQREICTTITDSGGDYAFVVKDNQPELKSAIAEAFGELSPCDPPPAVPADLPPDAATAPPTVEKGHGRIETRAIITSAEVVSHLAWPGAAQVARIWRERRIGDTVSTEVAYIVTSLGPTEASPACLLALVRDHWGIENRLHHVRDVPMDEDRCGSRIGSWALACLRNLTLATIRKRGLGVREARENFREDRAEAIAAVTGRIL